MKSKFTYKNLLEKGFPAVLIPGILLALSLGWQGRELQKSHYSHITEIFPHTGTVTTVIDGDTLQLSTGTLVRLLAINAPDRGEKEYIQAKEELDKLISHKTVFLEYDRYQDDKYGRILAWVWIHCESDPQFFPANYMHKTKNISKEGLVQNPKGCKNGILVNETLALQHPDWITFYKDRGELKYQKKIENILKNK